MTCRVGKCEKCTCGFLQASSIRMSVANANFAPVKRPEKLVRRSAKEAALRNRERFKETLDILS
ncbi:hypothetical protein GCM10010961_31560 [Pseudodonghicola xiamenensis]|uniref:Uncharacterized protein n=1 Tax=Pseudodonghicola xiamenensis TaxID=337702 RepID=A0A8J3MDK7_9RHOB|nr:hypothetical protein GCM10010961_31560 [Pseudodonghicola xiamenensis]